MRASVAGLTATQTAWLLGLSRKTVNRCHRLFREAIHAHQLARKNKLVGTVECDASCFGAQRPRGRPGGRKRGRGTNRQPVFGIYERGGQVFTEIVPDVKAQTLQQLVRGRVALDSVVMTDGWRGHDGLVDMGFDRHLRIRKTRKDGNPFTDGDVYLRH